MHPLAVPFEYSGLVYVPNHRGDICLLDPPKGQPDMLIVLGLEPYQYYRAELRFVPVPDPPATTDGE